jgi:tetratricopeptide (TPR) repeat protein
MLTLTPITVFILVASLLFIVGPGTARADVVSDCKSGTPVLAIAACSIVIDSGDSAPMDLALAYASRANAEEASGNHIDALADLNKAIEFDPSSAGAYSNRGNVYLALGDTNRALQDYNEAIRLDLDFGGAYFNRGNLYDRLGDSPRALADLTAAVHLSSNYAPAYFNRGIIYFRLGHVDDAISDFRKTLEFDPRHDGAQSALRQLENFATVKGSPTGF